MGQAQINVRTRACSRTSIARTKQAALTHNVRGKELTGYIWVRFIVKVNHISQIIILYFRLAEQISGYMTVDQYIVSTLSTRVQDYNRSEQKRVPLVSLPLVLRTVLQSVMAFCQSFSLMSANKYPLALSNKTASEMKNNLGISSDFVTTLMKFFNHFGMISWCVLIGRIGRHTCIYMHSHASL